MITNQKLELSIGNCEANMIVMISNVTPRYISNIFNDLLVILFKINKVVIDLFWA